MLLRSSTMIYLVGVLLVIWIYQNYKHDHPKLPKLNPLITNNAITYQNDHRNISRPWDNFDVARNLYAKQKSKAKKAR